MIAWRSSSTFGPDAEGPQLWSVPPVHSLNDLQTSILEWSVKTISFHAGQLPPLLQGVPRIQQALDIVFKAGAFPGEKCPHAMLEHDSDGFVFAAFQALEAAGIVMCCKLMRKFSTWQATQDISKKKSKCVMHIYYVYHSYIHIVYDYVYHSYIHIRKYIVI